MAKLSDIFLATFLGEEVMVVTSGKSVIQKDDAIEEVPLTYHGFIVDADSTFIYVGPQYDLVGSAVNKNAIISIERMAVLAMAEVEGDPERPSKEKMS